MHCRHELINEYEQGEKKGEQSSNQIAHEYFQLRTENVSFLKWEGAKYSVGSIMLWGVLSYS